MSADVRAAQADETAADQDWCSLEGAVTYWDGEVCMSCGRTWGEA